MDQNDQNLVAVLRENGRASLSELAARLGMSRTTVRTRLERLQNRGDIVGFSVVLKEDVADMPVRGLMMIAIAGQGTARIVRRLNGMSELRQVHSTNGRWDVIVEIGVDTLEAFDQTLNRIREIEGVTESETSLLLSTKKRA